MSQGVVKVIAQGPTGPAGAGGGGTIPVTQGGTGATTAAGARTNLGVDAAGTASSAVAAHASGTGVHSIAGVTGLQDALDAKETSGTASTAVAVHAAAADPHPGYRLESDTTDAISEGSSNLYHTAARVRAVTLTGLGAGSDTPIQATDGLLTALALLQAQVSARQATLVSGSNIKTVNGSSVLGSGDLTVSGGAAPSGSAGAVQISDGAGALSSSADLNFDAATKVLAFGGKLLATRGYIDRQAVNVAIGDAAGGIVFSSGGSYFMSASSCNASINNSGIVVSGNRAIGHTSGQADEGGADIALERVSAGLYGVTDGAGTYRDLKLRDLIADRHILPKQYTTATRPTLVNGAIIFDSDLDKQLIGGASAWEVVTSS